MKRLFTERHGAAKPRTNEVLGDSVRDVLLALVTARVEEEWFGEAYPSRCSDGYPKAGTDISKLRAAMEGYGLRLPSLTDGSRAGWSAVATLPPTDAEVFDLLEFSYEVVAEPVPGEFHSFMGHTHYTYDQASGRERFTRDVNRVFERNGIAFELRHGEVTRLAPAPLHEALECAQFRTGDTPLDELLEAARIKFLHRDLSVRRESLEKLWDAWERLKTIEPGKDKKARVAALIDKAATDPTLRARIENDAIALTDIGNTFMIRHTEIEKVPVTESATVDYLFHRMYALIALLLRSTGRLS